MNRSNGGQPLRATSWRLTFFDISWQKTDDVDVHHLGRSTVRRRSWRATRFKPPRERTPVARLSAEVFNLNFITVMTFVLITSERHHGLRR